jgi:NADPH2:quinone reductase
VPLADGASFELGADLGVPFLTAHRALTVNEGGPLRLAPGALEGRSVLVAGGAGAVGNAAIQLARWAGATVLTTVSSDEKAALATAAGAQHVINYRSHDVVDEVRRITPDGVDTVVEVSPANSAIDAAVLALHGAVAIYAGTADDEVSVPLRPLMALNARWQYVLLYTLPRAALDHATAGVNAAVAAGAVRVGDAAGLPLHHFPLEQAAAAHDAVEAGVVGKVLIDVA